MSWSAIKTEAIVISSTPFREADRYYSAMTRDFGKVEFVGRGARKGMAKLASHLEPFAVVDLEIIKGRRSMTVISVERKQVFRSLMDNISLRILAQTSFSLLNKHIKEHDKDERLYDGLLEWIVFLNSENDILRKNNVLLLGAFLLRMMQELGYEMSLANCVSCKQNILPLSFRWHAGRGGLVCSDCVIKNQEEWFCARKITEEAIKILRFASNADYKDLANTNFESEHIDDFAHILHDMMQYHLPVESDVPFWHGVS